MSNYQQYQRIVNDQMTVSKRLLQCYKTLGLNESELVLLLQIQRFFHEGNTFPTPTEIAEYLCCTEQECSKLLRCLIQKKFLVIEQKHNEDGIINEYYSLEPLWETIYNGEVKENVPSGNDSHENIFVLFEQEFGRLLSPFEIETINIWLDQEEQQPSLIKAALREAVLMGKLNFKYIDRILREWKKKGIMSVDQARKAGKQFRGQKKADRPSQENKRDISLYYNWLEDD
ncbi:DnaD domain-containing protein [Thalassobacillus pellis]|uniref:DnaD domain-containing protein n=1 Tax=Thalassobacillus pellis TaxID=748008 RepID=UPI0019608E7B|nr:DnaD domain-containing protein [Thalassobacillus pellis]MBM7552498.1 DNA replication protein [Thalassobacillus pellis]